MAETRARAPPSDPTPGPPAGAPERSRTGVPGLDEVLHGGLIAERLYLVDGDPGSGKTTLALQYLLEGRRCGERCMFVTLSESAAELAAGARSHGWSLEGIDIVELVADEQQLHSDEQLTMYHPAEVELTETMRALLARIEAHKPQRLVLDSLSELRLLAQSSLRFRRQVLTLKQFFAGRHCTALLLDDHVREPDDLQLQSIAHGVVSLSHQAPPYGHALRQLRIVKFRGSDFSSGRHDLRIHRGGIEVFPRLGTPHQGTQGPAGSVASGVTAMDAMFGGGIDRGTATLLVGPPGTGKSTMALQYAVAAAARGEHAAVFAFEESAAILLNRAAGLGMGVVLGGGPCQIRVTQVDPAEISPGEFAHMVRMTVERDDARVVVVDSLNGYLNAMPEDRYLTAQLHELLAYLNSRGVATFMIAAQSGSIGSNLRSPVDASYLADAVVLLRLYERAGRIDKAVSVMKKRSGRHESSIRRMWFDAGGVHLGEPLAKLRGVLSGTPVDVTSLDAAARPEPDGS